jgi:hypothetical protein
MEAVKQLLQWLKVRTNGGKTLAGIGLLVLASLEGVDLSDATWITWAKIVLIFLAGSLGIYGYEDVKKRLKNGEAP